MLYSALLIHLTGGRIETHFHVFGSLAFLAGYRDWKVLVPASAVVAVDHFARSILWPESVFGVLVASPWRPFEHSFWVLFEDCFLIRSCMLSVRDNKEMALALAGVETTNQEIEELVAQRTEELNERQRQLEAEIVRSQKLQDELVHAQKMESIGQLAAGIAHEINTPIQYIGDNTRFAAQSYKGLFKIVDEYASQLDLNVEAKSWNERAAILQDLLNELDIEFLKEEIPRAMVQTLEGVERVAEIVRAMKDFSHPGGEKSPADINKAIESAITVCKNRWKYVADMKLELDESLPPVPCYVSELNQVFLNLVVNAADAIAEANKEDPNNAGVITVATHHAGEWAEIRISDTGAGIPEDIQRKVFDPFFTTKAVGSGTGQGLSISHDVIVNKHHGDIRFNTKAGEGTTFILRLPLTEAAARIRGEAA